jgi:hypothetical protein
MWLDTPSGLGGTLPVRYQLVIDCADADRLARFWAAALGYELAPAPAGFATWNDFYRDLGLPEEDLADGADRISDPDATGRPSGSMSSQKSRRSRTGYTSIFTPAASGRTRSRLAGSELTPRPAGWRASAPPSLAHCQRKGWTTTRSG